jgi:hypothetical protein
VEADRQARKLLGERYRFPRRLLCHHQAAAGENAGPAKFRDRLVDTVRVAKVIGVDNEPAGHA